MAIRVAGFVTAKQLTNMQETGAEFVLDQSMGEIMPARMNDFFNQTSMKPTYMLEVSRQPPSSFPRY